MYWKPAITEYQGKPFCLVYLCSVKSTLLPPVRLMLSWKRESKKGFACSKGGDGCMKERRGESRAHSCVNTHLHASLPLSSEVTDATASPPPLFPLHPAPISAGFPSLLGRSPWRPLNRGHEWQNWCWTVIVTTFYFYHFWMSGDINCLSLAKISEILVGAWIFRRRLNFPWTSKF